MNIETLLREATHAHAGGTGPPLLRVHELAAVARWRARRRLVRQLLAGVGTAAALVAAGVVAVPQLLDPTDGRPMVLAPASYTLPTFPYTPGWVPEGVAEPNVQLWGEVPDLTDREIVVEHETTERQQPYQAAMQMRVISPGEYDGGLLTGPVVEEVVVRGAAGFFTSDGLWLSVTWTDPGGRLVQVGASERVVDRNGLLRYVDELVEEPLPVTPPVALASAPVGTEVNAVQPHYMRLDLPDGSGFTLMVHDPAIVDAVRADLRSSPDHVLPPPVAIEVAGRPAELIDIGESQLAVSISFGPELMLTIGLWRYGQESLLAFAEGATLTPHARPAPSNPTP